MNEASKDNIISSEAHDGAVTTGSSEDIKLHCISIIGQIEGHYLLPENQKVTKYEHIVPALVEVEQTPQIEGLLIILNTVGGDVEAGLAISELIASMSKPTVSIVLGGGHSIGVPLAVAAKRSFIVPSATMTLHPVRINGLVLGVPQSFEYLQKMQDRIISFIVKNSSASEQSIRDMIFKTDELANDVGSIIDGNAAAELGLIDSVGGLSDAIQALRDMIKEKN